MGATELAQETLEQMARVYMTDKGCAAAVHGYMDTHGVTELEAATAVAPHVRPAPHNVAAHDARYLLAPDTEAEDQLLLDEDEHLAEERDYSPPICEIHTVGPIPPGGPNEPAVEPQTFVAVVDLSAMDYYELATHQSLMLGHTECSSLCHLMLTLVEHMSRSGRVPVRAPTLTFRRFGRLEDGNWRVRAEVQTVPALNREVIMVAAYGPQERLAQQAEEMVGKAREYPHHDAVVEHNVAESWLTAVIYQPARVQQHTEQTRRAADTLSRLLSLTSQRIQLRGETDSSIVFDIVMPSPREETGPEENGTNA